MSTTQRARTAADFAAAGPRIPELRDQVRPKRRAMSSTPPPDQLHRGQRCDGERDQIARIGDIAGERSVAAQRVIEDVQMEKLAWPGKNGVPTSGPLTWRDRDDCCAA